MVIGVVEEGDVTAVAVVVAAVEDDVVNVVGDGTLTVEEDVVLLTESRVFNARFKAKIQLQRLK